jgi:starch synthase
MAGHVAALLFGIPHVVTAHSLEPLRPWKAEQLGGGYRVSSWVERTAMEAADAVIAVSAGMREDVLQVYPALDPNRVHVVKNGIDTEVWYPAKPDPNQSVLSDLGVDPTRPLVAFVGRITRQKGVAHLIAAAHRFAPEIQLVLCAGAPDTPEIAAEVSAAVEQLSTGRTGVFWVREMLAIEKIREILSAANVFVCPSVYEPLGIVNLEAMACATAVVASDVGGIPEVVADGTTGSLVHYDAEDPRGFDAALADAVNALVADPSRAESYGRAGRQRCIDEFSWAHIAEQTLEIYRKVSA